MHTAPGRGRAASVRGPAGIAAGVTAAIRSLAVGLVRLIARPVRGRPLRAAGRLGLAVALAAAGLAFIGPTTASAVPPSNHILASWNMLGGTASAESKWTQTVGAAMGATTAAGQARFEALALQEVGTLPRSAGAPTTEVVASRTAAGAVGPNYVVDQYLWNAGTTTRPNFIYLNVLPGPVGGHRGLAFATRVNIDRANMFIIQPQPLEDGTTPAANRPVFGIRLDANTVFWTGHARPEGGLIPANGNDAVTMVQAVNTVTPVVAAGAQWIFAADFNRTPTAIRNPSAGHQALPAGTRLLNTGRWTQTGGRELDYAVTNEPAGGVPAGYRVGIREVAGRSDHLMITMGVNLQAAATDGEIGVQDSYDQCLDLAVPAGGTVPDDTQLTESNCNNASLTQSMQINSDGTITDSGACLDDYGAGTAPGNMVEMWTCNGGANQTWVTWPNGQIYNPASSKCLDSTPPTNPPPQPPGGGGGAGMSLRNCTGAPSQTWLANAPYLQEPPGQSLTSYSVQTSVYIASVAYPGQVLCADPSDDHVYLEPVAIDASPYCQWQQIGTPDRVMLYNSGVHQAMAYPGSGSPLQMWGTQDAPDSTSDKEYFSWSGQQTFGGSALRPYSDSTQNLNADDPANPGTPATGQVTTHAWGGNVQAMSWITVAVPQVTGLGQASATLAADTEDSALTSSINPGYLFSISNGQWGSYDLCANKMDASVHLEESATGSGLDPTDPYCRWQMIGYSGKFILYNPLKGQVMAYQGGNAGPLVMEDPQYPTGDNQYFSFGSQESWGDSALRSFLDSGQNVDAQDPNSNTPNAGPLHTRGWNTGNQRALTWDAFRLDQQTLPPGTDCTPTSMTAVNVQQYVTAQIDYTQDSYGMLRAQANSVGPWESYDLCSTTTPGNYAIRSAGNNEFVGAATSDGTLHANTYAISTWEQYTLKPVDDGTYGIQSVGNGLLVSAYPNYTGAQYGMLRAADTSSIGSWNRFQ